MTQFGQHHDYYKKVFGIDDYKSIQIVKEHVIKYGSVTILGKDKDIYGETGDIKKILGHPPTLSDVLKVIADNCVYESQFKFNIKDLICFERNPKSSWNYESNLLRDQSDEVVDQVFKLLRNE